MPEHATKSKTPSATSQTIPLDGKPLKGKLEEDKGWSCRAWPYRILCRKTGAERLDILATEHRKDVYR